MTTSLYTIVSDYADGTFVSQVQATDERDAVVRWATSFKDKRPMGHASELIATAAFADDAGVTAIERLTGVWCWTAAIGESLLLVNIIRSAD